MKQSQPLLPDEWQVKPDEAQVIKPDETQGTNLIKHNLNLVKHKLNLMKHEVLT